MDGLKELRERYPWPDTMPDVPEDWMGWLCPDTAQALCDNLSRETQLVVECGTWLGVSARAILKNAPNAHLICIDTWKGSPEHWADKGDWHKRLATLYEVCQRNLWPWRDRVTMVREDSLVGLGQVYKAGLVPDLIYLDTKHTLWRVSAELTMCLELFTSVPIVGDDYSNATVACAADLHAKMFKRPMLVRGAAFEFPTWKGN